jgi:hypothetical protein|tara:strand:- start:2437 stop:2748 length:312 start_codon:yes stop_codon:yes gene_type:complete
MSAEPKEHGLSLSHYKLTVSIKACYLDDTNANETCPYMEHTYEEAEYVTSENFSEESDIEKSESKSLAAARAMQYMIARHACRPASSRGLGVHDTVVHNKGRE